MNTDISFTIKGAGHILGAGIIDVKIAEIFNLSSAEYQALLSFTKEENLKKYKSGIYNV